MQIAQLQFEDVLNLTTTFGKKVVLRNNGLFLGKKT